MSKKLLPIEIVDEIISFLGICENCDKYKVRNELNFCGFCQKYWCNKCNYHNRYVRKAYFEIYIPVCYRCYFKTRPKKKYPFRINI